MNKRKYCHCCHPVHPKHCCKECNPRPNPPREAKCEIVKNEICGNIEQPCDGNWVEYWSALEVSSPPTGSLVVFNGCGCTMNIRGRVNGRLVPLLTVTQWGQSKSVTVNGIETLEIQCIPNGKKETCSGRYCLTIQYPVLCEVERYG